MDVVRKTSTAEAVLDNAMGLFAVQGLGKTSLGDVARVSGMSKTGVLYHFSTMEKLREAAVERVVDLFDEVVTTPASMPMGAERDRSAVARLVDCALAHPGPVAFAFSAATDSPLRDVDPAMAQLETRAFRAFEDDPAVADADRWVRLTGVFATAVTASLRSLRAGKAPEWRPLIVQACFDLLAPAGDPTN